MPPLRGRQAPSAPRWLGAALAAGAGLAAYVFCEPHLYRLTTKRLAVDPACPPLRILHVSDTHMTAHSLGLARWLNALPGALGPMPDLVLATGDFIEDDGGIEPLLRALTALPARLG
ncbi:MAG TPA: metallophosphoesterase, partial [Acidimicrobiales bacterium]|nr:metallophosphoesterase [Acidimicrobiales bacterium]